MAKCYSQRTAIFFYVGKAMIGIFGNVALTRQSRCRIQDSFSVTDEQQVAENHFRAEIPANITG